MQFVELPSSPSIECLAVQELALRSSTGRDAFADCAGDRSAQRPQPQCSPESELLLIFGASGSSVRLGMFETVGSLGWSSDNPEVG